MKKKDLLKLRHHTIIMTKIANKNPYEYKDILECLNALQGSIMTALFLDSRRNPREKIKEMETGRG